MLFAWRELQKKHKAIGGHVLTNFRYDDTYAEYLLAQLKQKATRSNHLSLPLQQEQGNETGAQSDQEEGVRIPRIKEPEAAQGGQG